MATVKDEGFEAMLGIMVDAYAQASNYIDVPALEATAKALVEASGGTNHILMVDNDGIFTVRHPLPERFSIESNDLFHCTYYALIEDHLEEVGPIHTGLYVLSTEGGRVVLERIDG